MTNPDPDHADAGDYRRAAVIALHHRQGNTAGVAAIIDETNAADRAAHLLFAVLGFHHHMLARLRTRDGINLLADWVHGLSTLEATEPPGTDTRRAALILECHGNHDVDGIAHQMEAAITDNRATETFRCLLDLYEAALPELSSAAGIAWLEAHATALAGEEAQP